MASLTPGRRVNPPTGGEESVTADYALGNDRAATGTRNLIAIGAVQTVTTSRPPGHLGPRRRGTPDPERTRTKRGLMPRHQRSDEIGVVPRERCKGKEDLEVRILRQQGLQQILLL